MDNILGQKKVLKGKITRLSNIIKEVSNEDVSKSDIDVYLEEVLALSLEADKLLELLLTSCKEEDFDKYEYEMHGELNKLSKMKLRLRSLVYNLNIKNETIDVIQTVPLNNIVNQDSNVKLPRLELATFSGNFTDWISFRDLFNASVHSNSTLSDAQKLQYLKISVRGEAANLLHAIQISDQNYEKAWKILTDRFDNKTEIIYATLDKLFSQPNLLYESSHGLRKLIDVTTQCLDTLEILGQPVDKWDTILIYFLKKKLDSETFRVWMLDSVRGKLHTLSDFKVFVNQRATALASINTNKSIQRWDKSKDVAQQGLKQKAPKSTFTHIVSNLCSYCKESHSIYKCEGFLGLSVSSKKDFVKRNKLCMNCLKGNHFARLCRANKCKICNSSHHTMLHENQISHNQTEINSESKIKSSDTQISSNSAILAPQGVLLPTAIVVVRDVNGVPYKFRALLDCASQSSFIRENSANLLKLKRKHVNVSVTGLSSTNVNKIKGSIQIEISSLFNKNVIVLSETLIIQKITCDLPQFEVDNSKIDVFKQLKLADLNCNKPGPIDILLGADVFSQIMLSGRLSVPGHSLVAHETTLGWILMGQTEVVCQSITVNHLCMKDNIESQLEKFWNIEEIVESKPRSAEEIACESHFETFHSRDATGRFLVRLPFCEPRKELGCSYDIAIRRLYSIEKKCARDVSYSFQYHKFMQEYLNLNHMEPVPKEELQKPVNSVFYLPHHAVPGKTENKFRVVFDASARSSNGISLNDMLMVGPQLQDDLMSLLLRFRMHKIAMTADIVKMYRQIRVCPPDTDFQRIVWRNSPKDPIQHFRLLTVTYGTASAPYLATKCLQQLAKKEQHRFPEASKIIMNDFYVDDLLSGVSSIAEGLNLQKDIIQLLAEAGFEIRKWSSYEPELLEALPVEYRESASHHSIDFDGTVKTLGLLWQPSTDNFHFKVDMNNFQKNLTKRMLLSNISRLFDPMGWLTPVTIKGKILMQSLWQLQLDWDSEVPQHIKSQWFLLLEDLKLLKEIEIPRYVSCLDCYRFELHGFSDSSEKAYAAVVYLRTYSGSGTVTTNMMASKTRIAPLKTVTLPRLELCGALLLAKLMDVIKKILTVRVSETHYWTDSTVVLHWLASEPNRWRTFVANRVAEIQHLTSKNNWHYVSSGENPADYATRGISTSELLSLSTWWKGPDFLQDLGIPSNDFPCISAGDSLVEEKPETSITLKTFALLTDKGKFLELLQRFSSVTKLKRVTAYCLRFIHGCRDPLTVKKGFLTSKELDHALQIWIRQVQSLEFHDEIVSFQKNKAVSCTSKIASLNPFMDDQGVLRVGGRLRHSNIPYDSKHPILLPGKHVLTELIVRHYHLSLLHAGPQLVQSCIRKGTG